MDESAIRIAESALATNTGDPIEPTCQHGILSAAYVPALLPQFQLSGEVPLQGQSQRDGVSVQLSQGEMYQIGPYDAVSQYQSGNNFDFSDVVSDSYTITTAQPRNLNVSVF